MLDPNYSHAVFKSHFLALQEKCTGVPRSLLELGPGDSVMTAIWACVAGVERTILVDAGCFATKDANAYHRAFRLAGFADHPAANERDIGLMLTALNARYLSNGLASLRSMPKASVDFIFSNAVLEHVRREEFVETIQELFRTQTPGGISSHQVDLRDHLGGALNSLRISPARWESPLFAESGFYTNRLRASEISKIFTDAGYEIISYTERKWDHAPISRKALHKAFQGFTDQDLLVNGIRLVVRRPAAPD